MATYAANRRNEGNLVREASALQGLVVRPVSDLLQMALVKYVRAIPSIPEVV
jgi:hypothetical protein